MSDVDESLNASYEDISESVANILKEHPRHLSLMHLNTQSMVSSFNEFQVFLSQYPMDVMIVITMSETWLKENHALLEYVSLSGYGAVFRNRDNIRGGGVGAYISNSIKYKRRKDIENLQPNMEQLWFEVPGRNKHSKALIGVIYRSERIQSSSDWLDSFESLLGHLTVSWDGLLLVTGDINIDLLKPNDPLSKMYQSILEIFGLTQHVTKPTRVTQNSKTLIDHIVTNDPHCVAATEIIPAPTISDHDAVFACVNVRLRRFQPRYKWIRLERKFVTEEFFQDSANLPFSVIYGLESPDDMVNALNTLFSECIERHAPLNIIKLTRPPAPWMNANEIRKLQADRDRLRFEAHKTNSDR
jgi:hypothetical protein